jgi:hypothetical protein
VVIGHYPLNAHPARVGLEHLESYFLGWRNISTGLGLLQTVAFVGVTLAIALVVSDAASRSAPALQDALQHLCSLTQRVCWTGSARLKVQWQWAHGPDCSMTW